MPHLLDPILEKTFAKDKKNLEQTQLPIITISASYKEDIKGFFGYPDNETTPDLVLSRAHYSMAVAALVTVWGDKIDPKKAWLVDPTNYVSYKDWNSVVLTEAVGKVIARRPFLKQLKDLIDMHMRKSLPILKSITPPLLHLTQHIHKPILSFHVSAGNILAEHGKQVIQVVTDPHVRDDYLTNAHRKNIKFCVFDDKTQTAFLEKAAIMGIDIDASRVIITGPPVDPRILAARRNKQPWRRGILRLAMTTGGLGTNKTEIRTLLQQLLPELRRHPSPYQLLIYAGTHHDIYQMVKDMAADEHVAISDLDDQKAKLRVIYHPQIVNATELLIKYVFHWAHGIITKPSGDMAYDAVASGNFLLTLKEWGEWEHNVLETFEQKEISRKADITHIVTQLQALASTKGQSQSWIERAMGDALTIEPLFLHGAREIVNVTLAS